MSWVRDFFALFYPDLCQACGRSLVKTETCLCTYCRFHLPKTQLHKEPENKLCQIFWGRVPIKMVTALYYFQKGSKVQHLIHEFKYKGKKEIGEFLGMELGIQLKESPYFEGLDMVIPVPLHPAKERKRGFNQSEVFAHGISKAMRIPIDTRNLLRSKPSETQTRKSRFRRWQNVETIFSLSNPVALQGKKVLLVDDVITTGSTLEACAQVLHQAKDIEVYVATLAAATH